jgi:hypothetical protein
VIALLAAMLIGAALVIACGRLVRWWQHRPKPTVDEWCCRCGIPVAGKREHTVIDRPTDAVEAEMAGWGGTYVAASFCASHCPGGCSRHCKGGKLAA